MSGNVYSIKVWQEFTSDGSEPVSTPYKTISGTWADAVTAAKAGPNVFDAYDGGVLQ